MNASLELASKASDHFLGTRYVGMSLRQELKHLLSESPRVLLDFGGLSVTQSFLDELIGPLILEDGPLLVRRLVFKGCSEDVKEIIKFVAASRVADYQAMHKH